VGDHEAAVRVELALPETGVCTTRPALHERGNGRIRLPAPRKHRRNVCCAPKPELTADAPCCGASVSEPVTKARGLLRLAFQRNGNGERMLRSCGKRTLHDDALGLGNPGRGNDQLPEPRDGASDFDQSPRSSSRRMA